MKVYSVRILMLVIFSFFAGSVSAQFNLKKISKGIKEGKEALRQATGAAVEVDRTVKTVNVIKKTWQKDTSSNIRYTQVPDYRSREDVEINKKQGLAVENGEFKSVRWSPVTNYENQVFPSYIIGWANYRGEKYEDVGSSLGFSITTNLTDVTLKWEIECSEKEFFTIDSGYVNCDLLKNGRNFMPRINWNYRALVKHESATPLNLYFRLTDPNTGLRVEKLVNVNLRAISDCLLQYLDKNTSYLFVSYVNEDSNEIDPILKEMLNTKMIDAVVGYQFGPEYVDLQIAALWKVLHDKGFQYSSITNHSGSNRGNIFSQSVRTIDKSLKTSQANCVDGTVLFSSILKKMGIRTILVTVPGHCFLGYYTDKADTSFSSIKFLETTMLGDHEFMADPKTSKKKFADKYKLSIIEVNEYLADLLKGQKLSEVNQAYYLAFLDAKLNGGGKYKWNMEKYGPQQVTRLDVNRIREQIKPIPTY